MTAVEELDSFGNIVILYYSVSAAAKANKISYEKMSGLLNSGERYGRKLFRIAGKKYIQTEQYKIAQIDVNGSIVNKFKTITEAAEKLQYSRNSISKCLNEGCKDKFGNF